MRRDSKLTESEAIQLAELMSAQPRLTSIDVRNNETMGDAGAEALATFIGGLKSHSVLHVPRSVCGVTPVNSSLEVPKTLTPCDLRLLCAESERLSRSNPSGD